jgi:hypothetical protein
MSDHAPRLSRRELLRSAALGGGAFGLSALLAACSRHEPGTAASASAPGGSLQALVAGRQQLSLLGAQSELPAGKSLFTFGLSTPDNRLVEGGSPVVWVAKDQTGKAQGPFPARSFQLTAYGQSGDRSPHTELTSFFGAQVRFPSAGNWLVVAVIDLGGQRAAGQGAIAIPMRVLHPIGSKALSEPTPVGTTQAELKKICTREPPCTMHYVSLDRALRSGKPTVVSFGTPLLCTSRVCGPVVDEQLAAFKKLGAAKANFIHVEEFPQRDPSKPAAAFRAWGFKTEPWVVVIDRKGVIRDRFEGPVTAGQIEDALTPLLA